jgi:uncharacterized protein YqgV (UPF0045/DUF77 family)
MEIQDLKNVHCITNGKEVKSINKFKSFFTKHENNEEGRKTEFLKELTEVLEKKQIQHWISPIKTALENNDKELMEIVNQYHYIESVNEVMNEYVKQFKVRIYVTESLEEFVPDVFNYYELELSEPRGNKYLCELSKKKLLAIYIEIYNEGGEIK